VDGEDSFGEGLVFGEGGVWEESRHGGWIASMTLSGWVWLFGL
jgi:hypothetical protein